jgi:hypothetical protein
MEKGGLRLLLRWIDVFFFSLHLLCIFIQINGKKNEIYLSTIILLK